MDLVFHALSSQPRRRILDIVQARPGASVGDVAKYFDISRIAVMKHLRVLEEAELIIPRKQGRVRELYFNPVPIQMIYDRWTSDYSKFWASKVTDLKFQAEQAAGKSKKRSTGQWPTVGKKVSRQGAKAQRKRS